MVRNTPFVRLAQSITVVALATGMLAMSAPASSASDKPEPAGKTLIGRHDLPREVLERIARFKRGPLPPGESVLQAAQMADGVEWIGPAVDAAPSGNPYVIAVTVKGRAREDGDAATLWKTGWRIDDALQGNVLPGLSRSGLKAGQAFEMRAVGKPLSFKAARSVAPMVEIVDARNIDIVSVQVEVWSGLARTSWKEWLLSMPAALVGIVMLALVWWWRR